MDSFYDAPRRAPVPTQMERFCSAPVVPEVSMLCTQKKSVNNMPYNTWKTNHLPTENVNVLTSNRQNIMKGRHNLNHPNQFPGPQNSSQFLRKQVRFESPVLQQRPSLTYEPFNTRKVDTHEYQNAPHFISNQPQIFEKSDIPLQGTAPLNGKTFEEVYMANLPNRQLDLSLIDLSCNSKGVEKPPTNLEEKKQEMNSNEEIITEICKNKENKLPKTYREFLETQKKVAKGSTVNLNDSVTDIFNYKRNKVLNCDKEPLEIDDASKKCASKPNSKRINENGDITLKQIPSADLKNNTHIENEQFARQLTDHRRSIHDLDLQRSQSPMRDKYLPNYEYMENNFYQDRLQNFGNSSPKCDVVTQTSIDCLTPQVEPPQTCKDSEPTNKDLLKIIAQQNEQLLLLQKQVAMLLNNNQQNQPRQIEAPPQRVNYRNEKCVSSTQNENFLSPIQDAGNTPRKLGLSKFSIDLMTSFEVAIRQQHNKQNFINYEPKIQEVTESESSTTGSASAMDKTDKTVVDTSLHLREPVRVREMCPSPEPSININMNDYDSSEEEVSTSEIGATFYQNLMGQVNNILKNAQVQTKEDPGAKERGQNGAKSNKVRDKTMSRVKEATLKHLRNIGVTIAPINDSDNSTSSKYDSKDYSPTEISFGVKQILMKYLPDEELAKFSYKQAQSAPVAKDDNPGIINARPEFSFASVQYMRKYNLIPTPNEQRKPRDIEQVPKHSYPKKVDGPKILDITALKLQPKLL